ncbi:hypothetical protein [Rummeliibacillus pycnus]|uniref:hypothetical protein n=1 Tax=Rummeliibacillus pycnus TaxID=101070 RepID=UPI003D287BCA
MKISNLVISKIEIPIQEGTLRLIDFGDETTVEVEINVHPTVSNFLNYLDYRNEQVMLLSEDHETIVGEFEIHTGKAGILLVGDSCKVNGIDQIDAIPYEKRPYQKEKGQGISLNEELQVNHKQLFIHLAESMLNNEIHDKENQQFIRSLIEKMRNREELNAFELYLKGEISYLIDEVSS